GRGARTRSQRRRAFRQTEIARRRGDGGRSARAERCPPRPGGCERGVSRVSDSAGLIDATAYFAHAAKHARVAAVVNTSQISARDDSKSHAARDHWIAERGFEWSGIALTHFRPPFFAHWVAYPHKPNALFSPRGLPQTA